MDVKNILAHCDHTLLKQESTWAQIKEVCDDGLKYGCASVCIPASFVKQAADYVGNELKICTVIGFPNGYSTTAVKVFETEDAIRKDAQSLAKLLKPQTPKSPPRSTEPAGGSSCRDALRAFTNDLMSKGE